MSRRDGEPCKTCGHSMYCHDHPIQGDDKPRVYGKCQTYTDWYGREKCPCDKFVPTRETK